MIELRGLTKVFGQTRAVDHLTCTIEPGVVTGFLGPNGAGKSTTMRMILGLDRPTAGTATIGGRVGPLLPFRERVRVHGCAVVRKLCADVGAAGVVVYFTGVVAVIYAAAVFVINRRDP